MEVGGWASSVPAQLLVERGQDLAPLEDHIERILSHCWTEKLRASSCAFSQSAISTKGVILHLENKAGFLELRGQPMMGIKVNLQPAGQPGRHAHIHEPQLRMDEVELIGIALAGLHPKARLALLRVAPGPRRRRGIGRLVDGRA